MKKAAFKLFLIFMAHFILAIALGGLAAFLAQLGNSLTAKIFSLNLEFRTALYAQKVFLPGISFAIACALLCIFQFYLTLALNFVLKDKLMSFAAMCVAGFFLSNAFCRYTSGSFFVLYPFRWLPCQICAFVSGIAALLPKWPKIALLRKKQSKTNAKSAGAEIAGMENLGAENLEAGVEQTGESAGAEIAAAEIAEHAAADIEIAAEAASEESAGAEIAGMENLGAKNLETGVEIAEHAAADIKHAAEAASEESAENLGDTGGNIKAARALCGLEKSWRH